MSELKFTGPGGELKQDVTSVTLVNATAKTIDVNVPAGKKWVLKSIKAENPDDVVRIIKITKFKEVAKTNRIKRYDENSTTNGQWLIWPNVPSTRLDATAPARPEILIAANTIEVLWVSGGASAGGTDADGLVFEYLEFPASMKDKAILTELEKAEIPKIDWGYDPLKYPSHAKAMIAKKKLGYKQLSKNVWYIDGEDPLKPVEEPEQP